MDKKGKKNNIFLLVTLIILVIALLIGLTISVSYAIWIYSASQTTENTVVTDCFEIQYTDSDVINLSSAYPIIDSEAINLKPYNFTISNICKTGLSYSVNLEKLSTSTLDPTNIKIKLDNESIYTYGDNGTTTPILSEANSAIEIASGVLGPMSSKTYQLRLWVKSDAVTNDVKNKSFASKIAIKATLNKNVTTVNLNANGGNVSSNTISATLNSAIGTLPTPTKDNYVFAGWYSDSEFSNLVTSLTTVTSANMTLYAKWLSIGDIYKIGDEEFYFIGLDENNKLKLFSKYVLNVGTGMDESSTEGIQNSTLDGKDSGIVNFSSTNYMETFYNEIPSYVYSASASISTYVNNYVDYLKKFDSSATGRLINNEEIEELGCSFDDGNSPTCEGALYPWVTSVAYWTGVWAGNADMMFVWRNHYDMDSFESEFGVRPVIIIDNYE